MKRLLALFTLISTWWCMLLKTQAVIIAIISATSLSGFLMHIHMVLDNKYSCTTAKAVMFTIWSIVFLAFGWVLTKNLKSNIKLAESHRNLEESHKKLEEMQVLLQDLAIRDPLTGLYNRRSMIEELTKLRSYVQREQRNKTRVSLVLIFMDLDYLKKINDSFGHLLGDAAICTVAALLKIEIREGEDFLCRYGGDEFCAAIIVEDYTDHRWLLKKIAKIIYRIKKSIKKAPFFVGNQPVPLSITVGAHIVNINETDVELELDKADKKMQEKKDRRKTRRVS
jgi:diguanylate cyclase (GGDEF)-like protein